MSDNLSQLLFAGEKRTTGDFGIEIELEGRDILH